MDGLFILRRLTHTKNNPLLFRKVEKVQHRAVGKKRKGDNTEEVALPGALGLPGPCLGTPRCRGSPPPPHTFDFVCSRFKPNA